MPIVPANGLSFHIQELGAGPPAVLLHGLFVGSLATWYFTAAPELARSHRVLLFDLRGHGRTERPARGYDLGTMAGDLAALAAARLDARPLALAGHSYGALVALRFALEQPERVERLALVEAPLPPSRFPEVERLAARDPAELLASLPAPLRDAVARGGRQAGRFARALHGLVTETTLLADLRAEGDIPDAALARVACPVLCVYGERSSCRPVGERLARVIPGANLTVLSGGHYLPVEAPAALTRVLVEFLHG